MKIVVTGGAGFIGSYFVERFLSEGHHVHVVDTFKRGNKIPRPILCHPYLTLTSADIRDSEAMYAVMHEASLCVHLAAVLGVDIVADNPMETMEVEVIGTKNIVDACIHHGVEQILYTSTSGVYGKAAIEKAVNEDFHASPSSSYGIAKRYNEIYFQGVWQEKKMNAISIRPFNVYGTRQDDRMVIPTFFRQAMNGEALTVYGTGKQTRDFTHVLDLVEGTCSLIGVQGCHIVNVAAGIETKIVELAEMIVDIVGDGKVGLVDAPARRYDFEVGRRSGSGKKLQKMTGFVPTRSLHNGLLEIWEYLRRK